MKAELYTNCSLFRLPIKSGVTDYYLPQNVEWADRKIEKMIVCAPANACTDPVDGQTPVMTASDLAAVNAFVSLFDADGREIMHNVGIENILHTNNNPLMVDAKLNLSLCHIDLQTAPVQDSTLLLYVFYATRTEEYYDMPRKSVTTVFPMAADEELSLQYIINTYVHALPGKLQGIIFWNAASDPAYLSLRDYTLTYQMANIHSEMMRSDMNGGTAADSQAALFLLNDLDIDFDYSHIRESAGQGSTQKITFLYD